MKGSVRERRPGVYEIRVFDYRDRAGRAHYASKTVEAKSKRALEEAQRRFVGEVERGEHRRTSDTLASHLEDWLAHLESAGRSPTTLRTYRGYVRTNIVPAIGEVRLSDLTARHLDDLYASLRKKGRAANTVAAHHRILSAALNRAMAWGLVRENVALKAERPKTPQTKIVPPTADEIRALIEEAERRDPTLAVLLFLAATTGARRGELCALRWSDVDFAHRSLLIDESAYMVTGGPAGIKDTKAHQERRLSLDAASLALLEGHRANVEQRAKETHTKLAKDAFVFSQALTGAVPYKPDRVTAFFGRVRRAVGCDHLDLHYMRHFMATQAIALGYDLRTVAGRLGHGSGGAITMKVYAHWVESRDQDLAGAVGELLAKPEPEGDTT